MRRLSLFDAVVPAFRHPIAWGRRVGTFLRDYGAESGYGRVYARYAEYTMIIRQTYINNLTLVDAFRLVPGCVVECGVWRGGMAAGIAEVLGPGRKYFLFDSFEGLPPAREIDGPAARAWQADTTAAGYHDNCKAHREYAERAMRRAGATNVSVHPGWFEDTLPGFVPPEPIAVLRLDADWYDSTMVCLTSLARHMTPGGVILLDDYRVWDGCSRAVHDFLSRTESTARVFQWRDDVSYIQVPAAAPGAVTP